MAEEDLLQGGEIKWAETKDIETKGSDTKNDAAIDTVINDPLIKDNVILWQTYHRPPGNIKSGQHAGQGFVQLVLEQVTQNLPEYI